MDEIFLYVIGIAIGLALDWALYGRTMLSLYVLISRKPNREYRDHIFPRIILTFIGILLIIYGGDGRSDTALALIGSFLFVISLAYACFASYGPVINEEK